MRRRSAGPVLKLKTMLLLTLLPFRPAGAQTVPVDRNRVRQAMVESLDSERELTTDDEEILLLLDDPLDINEVGADELVRVPGITPGIASGIVSHRRRYGPFSSLPALKRVRGVTESLLHDIAPFLKAAGSHHSPRRIRLRVVQRLGRRLDLGRGFNQARTDSVSRYLGGALKSTTRIFMQVGARFSTNLTADHDAGEPFVWRPSARRFGPDFASWSVAWEPGGPFRTIIVGDIRYRSRLGLTIGSEGFTSFEQPAGALSSVRPRPFTSASESRRFRGLATHLSENRVELTLIASRRKRDARVDTSSVDAAGRSFVAAPPHVSLVTEDGSHRTETEVSGRGGVEERVLAARLGLRLGLISVGLNGHTLSYGIPVAKGDRPDQIFDFEGSRQVVIGLDALLESEVTRCAVEISRALGRSVSGAILCTLDLAQSNRLWFYGRFFGRSGSLLGSAMGRGSGPPSNERGVSIGWRSRLLKGTYVVTYADVWWSPWARYLVWVPSGGREIGFRIHTDRSGNAVSLKAAASSRHSGTSRIDGSGRVIRSAQTVTRTRMTARTRLSLSPAVQLLLSSSIILAETELEGRESGVMMSVGARYQHLENVDLSGGIMLHDAPSSLTRIYAYEPEMRFGFGAVSVSGTGERWYLLLSMKPARLLTIQVKYSSTLKYGARFVGSGLEEVSGSRIREIAFQMTVDVE